MRHRNCAKVCEREKRETDLGSHSDASVRVRIVPPLTKRNYGRETHHLRVRLYAALGLTPIGDPRVVSETETIAAIRFCRWSSCAAMNQFAAEWKAQKLSIRYVSGPRNQNFFSFSDFREPATIRIDKQSSVLKCIAWSFRRQFPKSFISQSNESIGCEMVCSISVYSGTAGALQAEFL